MDKNSKIGKNEQEWNELFRTIYSQYYSKLCVFADSILKDEDEAEEIVQRIITKLWEQRNKFDTIENIKSYLFRSVKNHCMNTITHKKIEDKYKSEAWVELKNLELKAIESDVTKKIEEQLHEAITNLPDKCQEILKMSKFDGYKNKEIAEKLDISVKSVEAYITKAFSILRNTLNKN